MEYQEARDQVRRAVLLGHGLDRIDAEVIETSELTGELKGALWLYGWSLMSRRRQQYELNQSLQALHAARAVPALGTD